MRPTSYRESDESGFSGCRDPNSATVRPHRLYVESNQIGRLAFTPWIATSWATPCHQGPGLSSWPSVAVPAIGSPDGVHGTAGCLEFLRRDSGLRQLLFRFTQNASNEGGGDTKFLGYFRLRMRSPAAKPEVQPDYLFLLWGEPPQDLRKVVWARPHVYETTPDIVYMQVQNSLALKSLLAHEW